MAFCVFIDGKTVTLKPEQALAVWRVLSGEVKPEDEKQSVFCDRVKRLYLNRENAPQSYLNKFPTGYDAPNNSSGALSKRAHISRRGQGRVV